jgi:serine/threonine-protein kinase
MSVNNLSGQYLGQYELRDLLGEGGMGAVYRAYQASLKREVAVKVLASGFAKEPGYAARFEREARTAAMLEHPSIVPVHDYGTQGDISYVVMRLLTGGALKDRIDQARANGQLPTLQEATHLLKPLASALDYAHSKGVIHRDIKPGNIMFDERGLVYLVDFGIAKLARATLALTSDSMIMGTPAYMSPEQWTGAELTPASDQYAFGILAYNLLTGQQPFDAVTPYALMHKHLMESPPPPQNVRPDLPLTLNPVLERALAKDAGSRFTSVTAFVEALEQAANATEQPLEIIIVPERRVARAERKTLAVHEPVVPAPRATPKPERRHSWLWLISVMLLIGLGVTAFALLQSRPVSEVALPTLAQLPSATTMPTDSESSALTAGLDITETPAEVVEDPTSSDAASLEPTAVANDTETATLPAAADAAETPTESPTPTASRTLRPTVTPIPTHPPTDPPPPTDAPTDPPPPTDAPTDLPPTDTPQPTATLSAAEYYALAVAAVGRGNHTEAVNYYNLAIALDSTYTDAYFGRAQAYVTLGNLSQAIADYRQVIALNPNYTQAHFDLGSIYLRIGDYQQAVDEFTIVITQDSNNFSAYMARAYSYQALNNHAQAVTDFTSALNIDGNSTDAYVGRAESYVAQSNRDAAIADFASAATLNPRLAYAHRRLGDLYYEADPQRRDDALASYRRYLELAGNEAEQYVRDRVKELESGS